MLNLRKKAMMMGMGGGPFIIGLIIGVVVGILVIYFFFKGSSMFCPAT